MSLMILFTCCDNVIYTFLDGKFRARGWKQTREVRGNETGKELLKMIFKIF